MCVFSSNSYPSTEDNHIQGHFLSMYRICILVCVAGLHSFCWLFWKVMSKSLSFGLSFSVFYLLNFAALLSFFLFSTLSFMLNILLTFKTIPIKLLMQEVASRYLYSIIPTTGQLWNCLSFPEVFRPFSNLRGEYQVNLLESIFYLLQ